MTSIQKIEIIVEYDYDTNAQKMVEKLNTIGDLTPLNATKNECDSGWIRAVNRIAPAIHAKSFNIDLRTATKSGYQGKWIIPFKKEDPKISEIWNKVREGVQAGAFCEAKVSIPNNDFSEQVILV